MREKSKLSAKSGHRNVFNYLSLITIMSCSFIGAGFVSGAEIYEFFSRFKTASYIGIFIFFFLSFFLCFKIIKMSCLDIKSNVKQEIQKNKYFNLKMYKNNKNGLKSTFFNKNVIRKLIVFCNCFFIAGAMVAGLKNLIFEFYPHNYFIVFFLCIFVVLIVSAVGIRGLDKLDLFVIVFVCVMCYIFITDKDYGLITKLSNYTFVSLPILESKNVCGSLFFAALYVFMNIMQFQPIVESSKLTFSRKNVLVFSLAFATALTLPLFCFVLFLDFNPDFSKASMPYLEFFIEKGGLFSKIFSIGLLVCLLTTLITCLIGLKQKISCRLGTSNFFSTSFALLSVLIISILPFKFFVSVIYPLLGFLNFIIFLFL